MSIEKVEILTYLHVKDDILDLYGFRDLSERSLFMNLNMVSGIGPRSAMNILSGTNPEQFKNQKQPTSWDIGYCGTDNPEQWWR